jgi:hypothetical protein
MVRREDVKPDRIPITLFSTLMIEAACSPEMFVSLKNTTRTESVGLVVTL